MVDLALVVLLVAVIVLHVSGLCGCHLCVSLFHPELYCPCLQSNQYTGKDWQGPRNGSCLGLSITRQFPSAFLLTPSLVIRILSKSLAHFIMDFASQIDISE